METMSSSMMSGVDHGPAVPQKETKRCGTCRHLEGIPKITGWVCANIHSDHPLATTLDDSCDEWEGH